MADNELGLIKDVTAPKKYNRNFLYFSAGVANLTSLTCGIALGWPSPMLPKLETNIEHNLLEPITIEQASWVGSLLPVGAIIGPLFAGISADKIGRKLTLLLATLPIILSFFLSAYAKTALAFFIARTLSGMSVGAIFTVLPMYIGEIAEDQVRGALGSLMQLFLSFGLVFAYSVGPFKTIAEFNLSAAIVPIVFLVAFFLYVPETPHFYITQDDMERATKSLKKLRKSEDIHLELLEIKRSVDEAARHKGGFGDIFKSRGTKRAFHITISLMFFQQFSGINVILFYTETIFNATGSSLSPKTCTIIIGAVMVLSSAITPMIVEKHGKRFLLVASAVAMCIAQALLGLYFYLKDHQRNVDALFWLPVVCLVTYIVFYCLGFGPIPWAVMGELFPPEVKSAASTATASICWAMGFILTKFFMNVTLAIGTGPSFWLFAACCALAAFYVRKYVPETSGKSLQEIQRLLSGNEEEL